MNLGAGRPRLRGVLRRWPPRRVPWSRRQVRDVNGHGRSGPPLGGGAGPRPRGGSGGAYPGASRDSNAR